MIKAILDLNVASVLRRIEQGDCPTEPALSVETLENMVHDLSRALAATPTPPTLSEDLRELVARTLAQRFIERGNARVTGSVHPSWEAMPGSYRDDFYADADAVLAALAQVKAS